MKTHGNLQKEPRRRRNWGALFIILGICAMGEGCSRQDTERLGSIGRKVMERAGAATASCREKIDGLKGSGAADSLQDRVALRLRWEKVLADAPIEVVVNGNEIELKGTVKTAEQRSRAVELAESTAGVLRVLISLSVAEEKKDD